MAYPLFGASAISALWPFRYLGVLAFPLFGAFATPQFGSFAVSALLLFLHPAFVEACCRYAHILRLTKLAAVSSEVSANQDYAAG